LETEVAVAGVVPGMAGVVVVDRILVVGVEIFVL
jgi:hypothetical protein